MSNTIRGTLSAGIAKWVSNNNVETQPAQKPKQLDFDAARSGFEAQRPLPGPPPFLEAAADALGLDAATLGERLRNGESLEAIAEAQGVSTESVLEAIAADFQASHPDASDDEADAIAARALEGPPKPPPPGLDAIAERLGVTVDELQARLDAGESLSDVAKSLGFEPFKASWRIPLTP